ncbi:MAG: SRPBCC family protein [Nocardioides sp.]
MAVFSATTTADAVVPFGRQPIWDALVDPGLVARLTPFVRGIDGSGDHWVWRMSGIQVLGHGFSPTFTERMTYDEPSRIEFHHDPPEGKAERAGVNGWYALAPADGEQTRLETSLEICVDLPLPRAAGPAVRRAMKGVMATMGDRFAKGLLDHLAR